LRSVHAPAQLVATFPERTVEFRFLDGHSLPAWSVIGHILVHVAATLGRQVLVRDREGMAM
jgi:cytochrome b561